MFESVQLGLGNIEKSDKKTEVTKKSDVPGTPGGIVSEKFKRHISFMMLHT